MPPEIVTGIPADLVEETKRAAEESDPPPLSVEVQPDDEGGFFKLIITWPENES